uniref:Uncharacterized protein n=1 Tax=Hyaloperonospora arabidopsidis (strain Emoy2) TaxID=559515 RepID=M4C545_HYAAE
MVNIPLMFMEVGWVRRGSGERYLDQNPRLWEVPRSKPEIVGSTWIDTGDCGRYLNGQPSVWGRYYDRYPRLWEVPGSKPEIA